jgi:uncharacterized repeat protein (TIGR01451 family)
MDMFDDGWLNPGVNFAHCQPHTLQFKIFVDSQLPQYVQQAYLNVWFDGDRNGDWAGLNPCGSTPVPEHIVIDHPLNIAAMVSGTHIVSVTTTVPVFNEPAGEPAWMRVTLSEQPSVKTAGTFTDPSGAVHPFGDGQGVQTSLEPVNDTEVEGFWLGETEDYLYLADSNLQPGLIIRKTGAPTATFGSQILYTVQVSNTHAFTAPVIIFDHIPPGTAIITSSINASLPGDMGYDLPHNAVFWRGEVPPNASVTFEFAVNVTQCDPYGFIINNRALAVEPGFSPVFANFSTSIEDCTTPPPPRELTVEKLGPPLIIPNDLFNYKLVVHNHSPNPASLQIIDPLPFEVSVITDTLAPNVSFLPPNLLIWEPALPPDAVLSTKSSGT